MIAGLLCFAGGFAFGVTVMALLVSGDDRRG